MAEAALFSFASNLLATIATPAFVKAYEKAQSVREARKELEDLRETIKTIQVVLLDAEKQQKDSAPVRSWIHRVSDVLSDAEDLFDEVTTDDMLMQQMKEGKHLNEVRVLLSKLNPIVSNYSIAKKVKAVRKGLRKISDDMTLFSFVKHEYDKPISGIRRGSVETGSFVDPKEIIGRDGEKEVILEFLHDKSYVERNISLISIFGIGGMGKSALAQLVYNDGKVVNDFNKRYWACISDVFDEKQVIGRIYQSMTNEDYHGLSLDQLQLRIREFINRNGKFLLVLDDLWDEDNARGSKLWSLLSSDSTKGSKIIITTRHSSVAKAMKADSTFELKGLSGDASWELFRRFAFTERQENVPAWIKLGENIVNKCADVPLAIKSVASLLSTKDTMEEWKSFENEQLSSDNPTMSTLRLSYDYLPSHLKHCFAYCSLFPKDFELRKQELIYLWIAQGYVMPKKDETLEAAGHACFMELFRRSFLQDATKDYNGGIFSCKMHDLVHDLAQDVAGEGSIILTKGMNQPLKKIRHVSVGYKIDNKWKIPHQLLEADRLRSSLFMDGLSCSSHVLDQQVTKFSFLRTLYLKRLNIENVPCSIGELKYLRYLNLSRNDFSHLPDSITKLVNLITLDISGCGRVAELPSDIGELISLRHLNINGCSNLWQMPSSFGELASLQHLSDFKVTKTGGGDDKSCGLNALATLNLRGQLSIVFDSNAEWCTGQIPYAVEGLTIDSYPNMRIPTWWREDPASSMPKLECLTLVHCKHIKHLPSLKCLPYLRILDLIGLSELEYIEEEEEVVATTLFFPSLQKLTLMGLTKLEGWSRRLKAVPLVFPLLSELHIRRCPLLESVPQAPRLQSLRLAVVSKEFVQQLLSPCSTSSPSTTSQSSLLQEIRIEFCSELISFPGEGLTSLRSLRIDRCSYLKNVKLAPNALEEFIVIGCPNLCYLIVEEVPEVHRLPDCLQQLIALGKLQIQ